MGNQLSVDNVKHPNHKIDGGKAKAIEISAIIGRAKELNNETFKAVDKQLLEDIKGKAVRFDQLASKARQKAVRQYYARQANLLRSVQEDRLLVRRFDEEFATGKCVTAKVIGRGRLSIRAVLWASICVNVSLAAVKCAASLLSASLAIISSLVDSMLDLLSGAVTWYTMRKIRTRDPYLYPRGCSRLEPLNSIIVSAIMAIANLQIMSKSLEAIIGNKYVNIDVGLPTILMMLFSILSEFVMYVLCKLVNSPSLAVNMLDHRNDCISNAVALLCAYLADYSHVLRFLDPLGAILVSTYVCLTWFLSGREHMRILAGRAAQPEFYCRILHVALDHFPQQVQQIETMMVYHLGTLFLVEVHIVLDRNMPVHQAYGISELLRLKIHRLPYVERVFVDVDHDTTSHNHGGERKDV